MKNANALKGATGGEVYIKCCRAIQAFIKGEALTKLMAPTAEIYRLPQHVLDQLDPGLRAAFKL